MSKFCIIMGLDSLITSTKLTSYMAFVLRLLMALGGTDSCIHLYLSDGIGEFHYGCKLIGHQGWIRGLQFYQVTAKQPEEDRLLLASAAGDRCK